MSVEMRLADEPFDKIKSGEKTVEVRLYDEKRRQIKVGDKIVFYRLNGGTERISATVVALYRFKSFEELFLSELYPKTGSGNMTPHDAAESMYNYYSKEQENLYGVLGIEIIR